MCVCVCVRVRVCVRVCVCGARVCVRVCAGVRFSLFCPFLVFFLVFSSSSSFVLCHKLEFLTNVPVSSTHSRHRRQSEQRQQRWQRRVAFNSQRDSFRQTTSTTPSVAPSQVGTYLTTLCCPYISLSPRDSFRHTTSTTS